MTQVSQRTKIISVLIFICSTAFGQTGAIRGTLLDEETGDAIIGGNVLLKGTTQGAFTDENGNFLISNVSAGNHTVVFSYIGFSSRELVVNVRDGAEVNIGNLTISSQAIGLEEVSIIASIAIDRKTPVAVLKA